MWRTVRNSQLEPLLLGLGIFLGLGVLYVASVAALGGIQGPPSTPRLFAADPLLRMHLVLALLIGYTAAVSGGSRRHAARDLRALRPLLGCEALGLDARIRSIEAPDRRRLALAMGLGALVGLGIDVAALRTMTFHPALGAGSRLVLLSWELLLNALLFAMLGRVGYESFWQAHHFAAVGRGLTEVPLLDPGALAPFARVGLRGAAAWFVGSSLASLLMLDAGAPGLVASVLAMTFALGVLALLRPTWGIHRRLRAAKARELAWVREAIARSRESLARAGPDGGPDSSRLLALLGYEARVEGVREWPFGTPTVLRFVLFLLLPLGSWLGGALVERLVDLWLR